MTYPHAAIGLTILGVAIWALTFWWGPTFGYLDLNNRHLARILAGAICFVLAAILMLVETLST